MSSTPFFGHVFYKARVLTALQDLREDPWRWKKLEGELSGFWSVRVWPYRIIYIIEKNIVTVTIVAIGKRKDVNRKMKK